MAGPLLDAEYERVQREEEEKHAKVIELTGEQLASDGWTDTAHRPLLNVMLVTPCGATFKTSIDTSGEEKTKEYVAEVIAKIIRDELTAGRIVTCVVLDGGCKVCMRIAWQVCEPAQ